MHLTKTEPIRIGNQIVYTGFSSYKDAENVPIKKEELGRSRFQRRK
jgi:hypothetical protein